jgi:hypothetical protein
VLTKEDAIARLRATGTLAMGARRPIVVDAEHARSPVAREVNRIMMGNASAAGGRHLAPSTDQVVLP